MNENYAFGIDLSKYNTSEDGKKRVNFDVIAAHNPRVEFIGLRAGISWGYQDPWFSFYLAETQRIGRVAMPYHVLYPAQNAATQMDNFFRILGPLDFAHTPLTLDLELAHDQTIAVITKTAREAITLITQRTGRTPILYTRTNWANEHLRVGDLPPVHWWLAQYRYSLPAPLFTPEYPCPPKPLPQGVSTWHFHQTTQRGASIGAPAMRTMDYNRFNGTPAQFYAYVGSPRPKVEELVTCPLDGEPCSGGKIVERF